METSLLNLAFSREVFVSPARFLYMAPAIRTKNLHKSEKIDLLTHSCKMLFHSPWRRIENIDDYAETLGFEHEQEQELFKAVMALDKKYRAPLLLFYYGGIP